MKRLTVGVLGNHRGWELLLRQEGVSYEFVSSADSLDKYAVLIATSVDCLTRFSELKSFLEAERGLLTSTAVFSHLQSVLYRRKYIKYLLPDAMFSTVGVVDIDLQCSILNSANVLTSDALTSTAYVDVFQKSQVVVLPFDPSEIVLDTRVSTRSFYAQRSRLPFERVARIGKGGIRRIVSKSLEILFNRCALPYIHRWYYPEHWQTLFSFRVDTDYASKAEIDYLYRAVHSLNIPASWFVDVGSQKDFIDVFACMEKQEIGIHCYDHIRYTEYRKCVENIRMAMNVFQMHALYAEGFAAPYGVWNADLAKAINHCGFVYSSEFAYDYDNVPSFPIIDSKMMDALQIPVHPISVGSLRRQGFSEEEMINYFRYLMGIKLTHREPMIFYHHPKNNYESVLDTFAEFVNIHNINSVRMIDYAKWWKRRDQCNFIADYDNNYLYIKTNSLPNDVWLHIVRPDGKEAFSAIQSNIDLGRLEWQSQPDISALPSDIPRIRKFNPWILLINAEDFVTNMFRSKRKT